MKKFLHILTICIAISWPAISMSSGVWKPELNFSLEGETLRHTMLWVSGFSYAVDAMGRMTIQANRQRPFCSPEYGDISSKVLFEILNERFMGQIISSEQATEEIMMQLPGRYPC
jgi:hypothetical protein